jgi:signal transduction histidine kinase
MGEIAAAEPDGAAGLPELAALRDALDQARCAGFQAEARALAAEAANQQRTRFFAAASHDLRQPLQALAIFAGRLAQANHDPALTPLISQVSACVEALDASFTELLDLASIELGAVAVRMQRCELAPVFERVDLAHHVQAFDKGLAFGLRGGHHVVHADPVLLERVIGNLVSNAIRYTDDGGVLVGCRRRAGRYALQVWDSGLGMSATAASQVFDEFYQVDPARTAGDARRRSNGLGLGLAIVKRLAGLMAMPIEVCSRPGRGTVFTLWLSGVPAVPDTPDLAARLPGRTSDHQPPSSAWGHAGAN